MLKNHVSGIELVQMVEDRHLFEVRLKAAFPSLRFLLEPEVRADEPHELIFLDTTTEDWCREQRCIGMLSPDGWTPVWENSPSGSGRRFCSNLPPFRFLFSRIEVPRGAETLRPMASNPREEVLVRYESLMHSPLYGNWRNDQPEVRRFLQRVIRLAKKDATNEIMGIDFATGRPSAKTRPAKGGGLIWIDRAAADWLRAQPNRFIGHFRLREEFETYHWPLPEADESEGDESAGCLRTVR